MRTKAWDNYKQSAEGQRLLKMFSFEGDEYDTVKDIYEFVGKTLCVYCPE